MFLCASKSLSCKNLSMWEWTMCVLCFHQFWVELLGRTATVHGHEGLCCRGNAVVIEVELALAFAFWAQTAALWTAGQETAVLGVHLYTHRKNIHTQIEFAREKSEAGANTTFGRWIIKVNRSFYILKSSGQDLQRKTSAWPAPDLTQSTEYWCSS